MNKRVTSIVLTGAVGLGGLTTGLVLAPAAVMAQTGGTTSSDALSDRVSRIAQALSGLVSDGTIDQRQADAVATALADKLPGRGVRGPRGGMSLHAAAAVLGVTEDALRTALQGGQTLAGVAESKGVGRQALIDALVAAASKRLDAEVAEGDLTQAQADQRKTGLVERVTAQVDRAGLPQHGPRGSADSADETGGAGGTGGTG